MPSGQYKIVPDFSINPGKPSPRPALRDGVVCRGSPEAPLLFPAPFSSPVFPSSRRRGALPAPSAHPPHRPRQGGFRGWEGQGCHPPGKARTNGLTGANSGELPGRASWAPRGPLTFPFSAHNSAPVLRPLPAAVYCSPAMTVRSAAGSSRPSSAAGQLSPPR